MVPKLGDKARVQIWPFFWGTGVVTKKIPEATGFAIAQILPRRGCWIAKPGQQPRAHGTTTPRCHLPPAHMCSVVESESPGEFKDTGSLPQRGPQPGALVPPLYHHMASRTVAQAKGTGHLRAGIK